MMVLCAFLWVFGSALSVFSASIDEDSCVGNRAKKVAFPQGCENVFLYERDIRVTVQLLKRSERYSARWRIDELRTGRPSQRYFLVQPIETLWWRMYQAFLYCSVGYVQLGQRFYSESLDTILPVLVGSLRVSQQAIPEELEGFIYNAISYEGVDGERLTHEHVKDIAIKRRLWSVSMISSAFESADVLKGRAVRFVVPEMNLMLEGIEGLRENRGKIFDIERRIWC